MAGDGRVLSLSRYKSSTGTTSKQAKQAETARWVWAGVGGGSKHRRKGG